jgi:hypothetical protein
MWQFKFERCPQVQEIISVVHWLSCFEGSFLLCLFTGISALGTYFFAPSPFSGAESVFHQLPLLSAYYGGLLFAFQFCGEV